MKKSCLFLFIVLLFANGCRLNPPQQKPNSPAPQPPVSEPQATPTPPPIPGQVFSEELNQTVKNFNGKAGIFAKNLVNSNYIAINADDIFPTASTHKLIVSLAIYKYLYKDATVEKKKQYDIYIKDMMTVSDNPAFYSLIREIERKQPNALTQVLTDLNLPKTKIHNDQTYKQYNYHSVTTPREMSSAFETIYREQYLGKEFSAILKEELSKTIYRKEIPRHMKGSKVLNKVGSLPGVLCDVGIVDDGKDLIIIAIYTTSNQSEAYASDFIANAAAKVYQALRSNK